MELLTTNQYNQSIGKSKLLSSTAGVGAIITTKIGYYILVSDVNKWDFVQSAQKIIASIFKEEADTSKRYVKAKERILEAGINFNDDPRFVNFLKEEKGLPSFLCLIGIPDMSLNEQFNTPNWKDHPVYKKLGDTAKAEQFMVKGTHFPKWFIGPKNQLKTYAEWKALWIKEGLGTDRFVPPRDATSPVRDSSNAIKVVKRKNESQGSTLYGIYKLLSQTNLILICPNGHLTDIPWPKYLRWRTEVLTGKRKDKEQDGKSIFDDLQYEPCCDRPQLVWTESKTKSEGHGSVFIECKNCDFGSGKTAEFPKITLEGINNLKPLCNGHQPWKIELGQDLDHVNHNEECFKKGDRNNGREEMRISLVTGNSVYYANGFGSLFVPQHLAENLSREVIEGRIKLNEKFERFVKAKPHMTKEAFWDDLNKEDFMIDNGFDLTNMEDFISALKGVFLDVDTVDPNADRHEKYRWQEYQCFCGQGTCNEQGLMFSDIMIDDNIRTYFKKIQQVEELKVTQLQLDFTRVNPKERLRVGNDIIESTPGQNVFSVDANEVYTLPATESFGEGLFFQFEEALIEKWNIEVEQLLQEKYGRFREEPIPGSQGAAVKNRINNNGYKHFLIHTFSHLIMRELEFSCGYPTASLKERLYISTRMAGVLIYTTEGAEGSMGGLVSQGQPARIIELIKLALRRAWECSSDPLCWESDGQGIFDLNVAACFSCALVSETACEEMNLGLDRRILIDEQFGFFRDLR